MANILVTLAGTGNWTKSYTPTADAFLNELRSQGWNPTAFNLFFISGNLYGFTVSFAQAPTANTKTAADVLRAMKPYFGIYFGGLDLRIQDSSAPTTAPVVNNNTALQNQINQLQASINNLSNTPKAPVGDPKTPNSFDKFATSLGVTTGVLAVFGVALVLVISKR